MLEIKEPGQGVKKCFVLGLKVLIATLLLMALFKAGALDFSSLRAATANPMLLFGIAFLILVTYVLCGYRWRMLLKCQGIDAPVRTTTGITLFGFFLNSFLPGGGVGGDAVRIAYVTRMLSSHRTAAGLTVIVDRFIGVYTTFLIAGGIVVMRPEVFFANPALKFLALSAGMLIVGIPAGVAVFYIALKKSPWLRHVASAQHGSRMRLQLYRFIESVRLYRHSPLPLLGALGLSLIIQGLSVVCIVAIGHSLRIGSLPALELGFAAPWAWVANLMPVTPGGLGVGEAAFDRICHWMEHADSASAYGTIFLVFRLTAIAATIPGLFVYMANYQRYKMLVRGAGEKI